MKIQLISKSVSGKVAAILSLVFIALMGVKLSPLGEVINLPLPTPFLAVIGVVGFVFGIISFSKNKDRSVMTLLSMLVGLLIIIWTLAEVLFPHKVSKKYGMRKNEDS